MLLSLFLCVCHMQMRTCQYELHVIPCVLQVAKTKFGVLQRSVSLSKPCIKITMHESKGLCVFQNSWLFPIFSLDIYFKVYQIAHSPIWVLAQERLDEKAFYPILQTEREKNTFSSYLVFSAIRFCEEPYTTIPTIAVLLLNQQTSNGRCKCQRHFYSHSTADSCTAGICILICRLTTVLGYAPVLTNSKFYGGVAIESQTFENCCRLWHICWGRWRLLAEKTYFVLKSLQE